MLLKMAAIGLVDGSIARALVDELSLYPVGTCVTLSTGRTARVLSATSSHERPCVGTILDRNGQRLKKPEILDLSKLPGITIRAETTLFDDPLAGF